MKQLEDWYIEQTRQKQLIFDDAQLAILQHLDVFIDKFSNQSFLAKLFYKPKKLGYYIYGSVGRGKSMIMNQLYLKLPVTQKTRIHFHEFMYHIHQQLAKLKNHDNPLKVITRELKSRYKIIFLDEMMVNDIATAMILKNLFEGLFQQGIYIITSSNSKPDMLYYDGLMRDRFLPAIELLNHKLNVISLNSPNDYRTINSSINELFIINDYNFHPKLENIFNKVAINKKISNNDIKIQNRKINVIRHSDNAIWFNFAVICGEKRSSLDYLELAATYEWFIIENIYHITDNDKDMIRRFTWLIDILYDNHKKLALSSVCELDQIYIDGELSFEFKRTLSRLTEMQTKEYLEYNKEKR